jgi:putative DNA primase/helicase
MAGGDVLLVAFLQRIAGYVLTGHTFEHALFFLFGGGSNGKSLFIRTLAAVMADYAKSAPMDTFMASTHDRHPTDLADMLGARLVFATETEKGRRWAEAKLKQLSGGDTIKARLMRQDFFEFQPQFKLVFAGNHKPSLRSVDEAIRRRLHLLHFRVTIPPEERDRQLYDKLRQEWPAILRWMLDGCLEWRRVGLAPPPTVGTTTAEYLASEDLLEIWIEERCVRDPASWIGTAALHASHRAWAAAAGEHPESEKGLAQALEDRGYIRKRGPKGLRGFAGLRLAEGEG